MTALAEGLMLNDDGKIRCAWAGKDALYLAYHDHEWGKPVYDDNHLFEKICLEGFQAGLSWLTILRKRENFRNSFDGFDFNKIAFYDEEKIDELLKNPGIVRHIGKIRSVVNNAKCARKLVEEKGNLANYFWSFRPPESERFKHVDYATIKLNPITPASIRLSKDLKKRGWTFVGPTTCYAFMQSIGIVNDHIEGCFCR